MVKEEERRREGERSVSISWRAPLAADSVVAANFSSAQVDAFHKLCISPNLIYAKPHVRVGAVEACWAHTLQNKMKTCIASHAAML